MVCRDMEGILANERWGIFQHLIEGVHCLAVQTSLQDKGPEEVERLGPAHSLGEPHGLRHLAVADEEVMELLLEQALLQEVEKLVQAPVELLCLPVAGPPGQQQV